MMTRSMSRNAIILSLFAVTTATLLALTNAMTQDRVACNRQLALVGLLQQVMPAERHNNLLLEDRITVRHPLLGRGDHYIYRARQGETPTGLVIQATAPDGYSGDIQLLVGTTAQGDILAVRVVPPHNETPGLGDKIEVRKSSWITSFDGLNLDNTPAPAWAVDKDGGQFDSFSGATITPRAVVNAVHRALQYKATEHDLFALPADTVLEDQCNG